MSEMIYDQILYLAHNRSDDLFDDDVADSEDLQAILSGEQDDAESEP